MNYSLNVKSSSIVHTLLSNCVKLLGKVQKLLIKCISYSVISKRIRVVSPKFYTARKNFTGPPVPTVPTNFKSAYQMSFPYFRGLMWSIVKSYTSFASMQAFRSESRLDSGMALVFFKHCSWWQNSAPKWFMDCSKLSHNDLDLAISKYEETP